MDTHLSLEGQCHKIFDLVFAPQEEVKKVLQTFLLQQKCSIIKYEICVSA